MSEEKENNQDTSLAATRENIGKRVDPILEHLVVENSEFDKKIIRESQCNKILEKCNNYLQ